MGAVAAMRRPFPRAAAFLLPLLGAILAAAATGLTVVLHNREDAHRHRQVGLVELRGSIDQLQAVAWSGRPDLVSMRRAEATVLRRLRALGLPSMTPAVQANFAALNSIAGGNLVSDEQGRTYQPIAAGLAAAADAAQLAADTADIEALIGSATAFGLLLLAFSVVNVRLDRTHRRAQAARLRLLTSTVAGADEERRRIAADLHDGPIQQLTATAFSLDLLTNRLRAGKLESIDDGLRHVRSSLAGQMDSLRRLMSELRPPVLDEGGVAAAIASRASQLLPTSVECTVHDQTRAQRLLPELEMAVYRIAGEALANVAKHSRATHVEVSLERRGNDLILAVVDDGVGFDLDRLDALSDHLGLTTMRERVESVGGALSIRSRSGDGTRITATLPWRARVDEEQRAVA